MSYRAPVAEMAFTLRHVAGLDARRRRDMTPVSRQDRLRYAVRRVK